MTVVPPTARPMGMITGTLPTESTPPKSRYMSRCMAMVLPLNSSRVWSLPSSRITTARPASARALAAAAPPAPVPTTTTSHSSSSSAVSSSPSVMSSIQLLCSRCVGTSTSKLAPRIRYSSGSWKWAAFTVADTIRKSCRLEKEPPTIACKASRRRSADRWLKGRRWVVSVRYSSR